MSNTGTYKVDADGHLIKVSDKARVIFDAYFRNPYFEPHLADAKHPYGREVRSKRHKAQLMKEQGVREAGDKRHGAR